MSERNPQHNASKDPDKRYFPRWEVDEDVSFHLDGEREFRAGKTKDISCAGACIIGDIPMEPRRKVKMTIQLSKNTKIKVNAYILWVKVKNDDRSMGVSFYDTSDEVQDAILQHAFRVDRDKVIEQWFRGWN